MGDLERWIGEANVVDGAVRVVEPDDEGDQEGEEQGGSELDVLRVAEQPSREEDEREVRGRDDLRYLCETREERAEEPDRAELRSEPRLVVITATPA